MKHEVMERAGAEGGNPGSGGERGLGHHVVRDGDSGGGASLATEEDMEAWVHRTVVRQTMRATIADAKRLRAR